MAIQVDILKLMKMLETTFGDPTVQWRELKRLLQIQKAVSNGQKPPEKSKRGRPRKVQAK
jgi:hypothetical protein